MVQHEMTTAILALALAGMGLGSMTNQDPGTELLIDFSTQSAGEWVVVNDGVMGGMSSSAIRPSGDGTSVFEGNLSLDNNGGFASVRTAVPEGSLAGFNRLVIRVRGDGKRYQMRLRMSAAFDGIAYRANFEPAAGEWVSVEIPLSEFEPSYRGYRPRNAEPLDPSRVRQIGVMLTDKQEGPFRLEIAWIGAARD